MIFAAFADMYVPV